MIDTLLWVSSFWIVTCGWFLIANHLAHYKRMQLINRWAYSGEGALAHREFDQVKYSSHFWRVFFLQSPKRLYGPLIQGVWNHTSNMNTYDENWWKCYNGIYLKLNISGVTQRKINKWMAKGYALPAAMVVGAEIDVDEWLKPEPEQPAKLYMTDGAEEYEAIMKAQEIMNV